MPLAGVAVRAPIGLRFGLPEAHVATLNAMPLLERRHGQPAREDALPGLRRLLLLSVIFVLTALVFVPIGQLCGVSWSGARSAPTD